RESQNARASPRNSTSRKRRAKLSLAPLAVFTAACSTTLGCRARSPRRSAPRVAPSGRNCCNLGGARSDERRSRPRAARPAELSCERAGVRQLQAVAAALGRPSRLGGTVPPATEPRAFSTGCAHLRLLRTEGCALGADTGEREPAAPAASQHRSASGEAREAEGRCR